MALSADDIKAAYPLPVYNYRVEFGGEAVAFSKVSGLSISYETATYKESPVESGMPGPRVMHMPAQRGDVTVTLEKGVVLGTSIARLFEWIKTVRTNQVDKKDVFVRLCDEEGMPVITWKVANAFPIRLDAPTFDATSNDVAIETLQLKADFVTLEAS